MPMVSVVGILCQNITQQAGMPGGANQNKCGRQPAYEGER